MSSVIPQSYFIYKELLARINDQKKEVKAKYESQMKQLDEEMLQLKEQFKKQSILLNDTTEYILELERKIEETYLRQ